MMMLFAVQTPLIGVSASRQSTSIISFAFFRKMNIIYGRQPKGEVGLERKNREAFKNLTAPARLHLNLKGG
jgi:hypothetical protein